MLLRYFYDTALAHASYLVGCQRAKEALIVDPGRDIEPYLETARREGLRIVAVAETHIHADYVSGARELADRVGAKLYVSDEGPAEWKYQYATAYSHHLCKDGDRFSLGKIEFQVLHTPGHTPESISFLLTDNGGGANSPMGIFTGDFIFVGSIGRPDLLEEAAGLVGTAQAGAHQLFHSMRKFRDLPDHLQVWPAHGAGSACGKGLGAVPSSTVGYEKLFNPALQYHDEAEFVSYILSDQPEAPSYFAVMKRVNKEGPQVLGPPQPLRRLSPGDLDGALANGTVVDLSAPAAFAAGHVPGSLNIPASMLAAWAGWVLDYSRPAYLIADDGPLAEAVRVLQKIGVESIGGVFSPQELQGANRSTQTYASATPQDVAEKIAQGEVDLIDVRAASEWQAGHIPQAAHRFLGRLPANLTTLGRNRPIVAQCRSGARSAIAASILQRAGFEVINLTGGFQAWAQAGLPTTTESAACGPAQCSVA